MKQCQQCQRLLSDQINRCIYCKNEEFRGLTFASSSISPGYLIYAHELVVDDAAYTIVNPLGKGGFGTVIKVLDNSENRYYAMKVPLLFDEVFSSNKANKQEDIDTSAKYLQNEIDTIMKYMDDTFLFIHKKGVATATSHGKKIKFPVFIMELAECTVKDLIHYEYQGKTTISFDEKIKMIRETVNTISRLHSMNVVHRDLSPDNVFVVDRGGKISYVLGDFGASKRLVDVTMSGQSSRIVGHSAYLDPARFDEKYRYDLRVDIYSLGIIITEILMGKFWVKEFGEENISHLVALDFEKEFLLDAGKNAISDNILEVLRKAVKRDPEERYASVDEFRKALFTQLEISSQKMTMPLRTTPPPASDDIREERISVDFSFTVPLPFASGSTTFAQDIVHYDEDSPITLRDFRGAQIQFQRFTPRRVEVKGTSFYNAVVSGNSILLNFKNSEFLKLLKKMDDRKNEISGELNFLATLETEGVPS